MVGSGPLDAVVVQSLIPFVGSHLTVARALLPGPRFLVAVDHGSVLAVTLGRGASALLGLLHLALDGSLEALLLLSFHAIRLPAARAAPLDVWSVSPVSVSRVTQRATGETTLGRQARGLRPA
jgi:hypothetical protein